MNCPRCGMWVKSLHYHELEVCQARIDAVNRRFPEIQLRLEKIEQCPGQMSLLDEEPED